MNKQEIREKQPPVMEDLIVGKFANRQQAENAAGFLEAASFSPEQMQIEKLTLKHLLNLPESNEIKNGAAGALVGAALGITIGLSIYLIVESLPDAQVSIGLSPLLIVIMASVLGAVALGLIGTISGGQVPESNTGIDQDRSSDYGLIITGKKSDLIRAKEILRQQGMQV
jgi:hypothetical protein